MGKKSVALFPIGEVNVDRRRKCSGEGLGDPLGPLVSLFLGEAVADDVLDQSVDVVVVGALCAADERVVGQWHEEFIEGEGVLFDVSEGLGDGGS